MPSSSFAKSPVRASASASFLRSRRVLTSAAWQRMPVPSALAIARVLLRRAESRTQRLAGSRRSWCPRLGPVPGSPPEPLGGSYRRLLTLTCEVAHSGCSADESIEGCRWFRGRAGAVEYGTDMQSLVHARFHRDGSSNPSPSHVCNGLLATSRSVPKALSTSENASVNGADLLSCARRAETQCSS